MFKKILLGLLLLCSSNVYSLGIEIPQSTATVVEFFLADANGDGVAGETVSISCAKSSAGTSAAAAVTNSITESDPNGWYDVTLTTSETDTLGWLKCVADSSGADRPHNQAFLVVDPKRDAHQSFGGELQQSSTPIVEFFLADDDGEGLGGLSPTISCAKSSGTSTSAAAVTNTITESDPNGWYDVTLTASETDTLGAFKCVADAATASVPNHKEFLIVDKITASEIQAEAEDALETYQLDEFFVTPFTGCVSGTVWCDVSQDSSGTQIFSAAALAPMLDVDMTAHQTTGTFGQAIGDPVANTETIYDAVVTDAAGTNIAADIIVVDGNVDDIELDTNELQTDDYPTSFSSLNNLSAAQVNAEVVDVLTVDTHSELAQGAPTATPTFVEMFMLIYMERRNEVVVNATHKTISNDAGTVITKKAYTNDGTTYTETEMETGP